MSRDAANVVGNTYDKYGTKNPVARWLMAGFLDAVTRLYDEAAPTTVLEVGCGEGKLASELLARVARRPTRFVATDVSLERRDSSADAAIDFREASVYELPFERDAFDLVLCCEVLEHLEEPDRALREIDRVARRAVIVSTPREPLWRVLNVARGKYLRDLGNTPGHIQHFGRRALVSTVARHLRVERVLTPPPWTILRASVR